MSETTELDRFFAGGGAPPSERVNGRYKLAGPDGEEHSYQTASNYGFPLTDQFGLNKWRMRQLLIGVSQRPDLIGLLSTMVEPDNGKLDEVIETALQVAGTTIEANRGTTIHSALQAADEGKPYPPEYASYVDYYRESLAHYGLRVVMTERLVVAPELGAAGRLDRIFEESDGTLVLGDVKTSDHIDLGAHEISVQLAVYQGASHVRGEDGKSWMSLRDGRRIRDDYAVVVHVDRQTGAVSLYRVDLLIGRHGANLAGQIRGWRKSGPVLLPYVPPMGTGPNTVDPATVAQAAENLIQATAAGAVVHGAPQPLAEQAQRNAALHEALQEDAEVDAYERNTDAHNEAADMFGGPTVTGPPPEDPPDMGMGSLGQDMIHSGLLKTSAELMKPSTTKAQVQQYCRQVGITDLAHTKKVLVEMLAKAGKLAPAGSQPAPVAQPSGPQQYAQPAAGPHTDAFRQLQLARITAATSVGDLQTLNREIVNQYGDQAWSDELTEAARAKVAQLDALDSSALLQRIAAASAPEDLARLWEEVTIGNSVPGNWTSEIHEAASARLTEINNSRPPAPANPFAGGQ